MLTAYLGDAINLQFTIEDANGSLNYTGLTVKATLVKADGTGALSPTVVCSPTAAGAVPASGKAVAVWTAGTYPLLVVGQCQLEVAVVTAGAQVTWPRIPVRVLQGFTT